MTDRARDVLRNRLAVAEEICSYAGSLAIQADVGIRERRLQLTRKDDVLIGLARKIDGSFRALIDDCKAERSEAMHHLKTMAECLICFYAVLHDPSDATARRLLAKAFHDQATFFRENPAARSATGHSGGCGRWKLVFASLPDGVRAGAHGRPPRIHARGRRPDPRRCSPTTSGWDAPEKVVNRVIQRPMEAAWQPGFARAAVDVEMAAEPAEGPRAAIAAGWALLREATS